MFDAFTGGYVHVLLFCHLDLCVDTLKVKVTQSCPTLWDPTDYTVHGILQARIPEWVQFSSVGSLSLLQGIFPTQGLNQGLLHYRWILSVQFSSVQSLSHVQLFVTPWTVAHQASLSFTITRRLLKLISIESVMPSSHLILCCCFSSHLQSFPASGSFPVSQFFASGGQRIGALASASVLPMNIQD